MCVIGGGERERERILKVCRFVDADQQTQSHSWFQVCVWKAAGLINEVPWRMSDGMLSGGALLDCGLHGENYPACHATRIALFIGWSSGLRG